jgi:hypothetical protein
MGVIGLWAVKMPRRPSSPVLPPSRRSCLRAAGCHSSWSRRTSESHPAKQDRLCRPVTCRFGSWRGDSNPQPAVYKTGANRPRRTPECCPGSSGRGGRPASALLTGRVVPGGMTSGMTSGCPWHHATSQPRAPSGQDSRQPWPASCLVSSWQFRRIRSSSWCVPVGSNDGPWDDERNEGRHSNLLLADGPLPHGAAGPPRPGRPNLIPNR